MLDGFWHFCDRKTGERVILQEGGAILSEKTAAYLGVGVGDTVTAIKGDDRGVFTVTGITENYVQHYLFITDETYEKAFGKMPEKGQVLLRYAENTDRARAGSRLLNTDGVAGVYDMTESIDMIRHQLNGVYPAVAIIISAAAALAFVVLYNLNSINITERIRELATLKVLGFWDSEVSQYVFRENIVLTGLGILLGVVLGKYFHAYLITTVEVNLVMFGRRVRLTSYLLAVGMTIFFALLVNLASSRRLRKIDMVESLKSVE